MVIVWRLRGNIIRTALCWVVTQCSQSAAHSYEQFLQVQQIGFVTLTYNMFGGTLNLAQSINPRWVAIFVGFSWLCISYLASLVLVWIPKPHSAVLAVVYHCEHGGMDLMGLKPNR